MRITSLVRVMVGLVGACIHAETRVLSEAHSFCRAERDLWTPKRSYPRWVTMDPGEQEDMAVLIHVTNPWTCLETALERVCHNKYWATFCLLLVPVSREPTETPGTFKCFFFFPIGKQFHQLHNEKLLWTWHPDLELPVALAAKGQSNVSAFDIV